MRGGRGRGSAGGRGGGGRSGGGGSGFGFNAALGADGDKDDPAFQHLRAMAAESRQAFRSVATAQRDVEAPLAPAAVVAEGEPTSVADGEAGEATPSPPPVAEEPKPKKAGGRANFLKKLLPGLVIPASLPPEALPTPAFVDRTIDNFDFSREVITAARGAVVRSKHTRVPTSAVPPRPSQLPEADSDGRGQLKPWYNLVASTGCRTKDGAATVGPSLFIFAHADFAGAASLLTVACRNAAKCVAARALPEAGDDSDDVADQSDNASEAGSQPAAKAHRAENEDEPQVATVELPTVPQVTLCMATETQSEETKEVQEALRFGMFMHVAGGGAWLWAALAAVHTPVHPDLDRDLHKLFQSTVKHLAVLRKRMPGVFAEALADQALEGTDSVTVPQDTTTASDTPIVVPFSAASATPSVIRSLLSLLVVLGKVFNQANPSLMPL